MPTPLQNLQRIWELKKSALNLSQTRAAERLGISQPGLHQYLAGKIPLNTDFILQIAKLLKVNPLEIDPRLQQVFLPQLRRIKIPMVNEPGSLETFGSTTTCLGFRIPTDFYAPRYLAGDAIIFVPLQHPEPQAQLLAYNDQAFYVGTCTSITNTTVVLDYTFELPIKDYNYGLVESIIPK